MATTSKIVAKLNLKPHPEGGFYSETMRDTSIILSKSQLPSRCKSSLPLFTPGLLVLSLFILICVIFSPCNTNILIVD